jgi:hypothetical protein
MENSGQTSAEFNTLSIRFRIVNDFDITSSVLTFDDMAFLSYWDLHKLLSKG